MTERAPEDDFDEVGSSLRGRRGAHRQAPRRLASALPVVGVLAAVVAVGWAVTAAVGLTGGAGAASTSAESAAVSTPQATSSPADTPATDAPATGAPSAGTSTTGPSTSDGSAPVEETAAGVPPAEETSASSSASSSAPSSSSSSSSSAAAVVDEDVDVIVLNATRTSGLAASTASALEADGWTVASTGNERDAQPAVTVVLFPSADLEATAIAVAGDLGSKVVARLDASAADDAITVLAGPDRAR